MTIEKSISAINSLFKIPTDKIDIFDGGIEKWINS